MAWVTPSEMLADTIFTKSGGFVFEVSPQQEGGKPRYLYFPVVPPTQLEHWVPTLWTSPVHIPEYLVYYRKSMEDPASANSDEGGGKYASDVSAMSYGDGAISAHGIAELMEKNEGDISKWMSEDEGVVAIQEEFKNLAEIRQKDSNIDQQEDWVNFNYCLHGTRPKNGYKVVGNDGKDTVRDKGRDENKRSLEHFVNLDTAKNARLKRGEVLALRLYTSSSFRQINEPLRKLVALKTQKISSKRTGHVGQLLTQNTSAFVSAPDENVIHKRLLHATVYMLSTALKKLRVQAMQQDKAFQTTYLWRGMRNLRSSTHFLENGGAEGAPMSTTPSLRTVASYSQSDAPLLLKIKIDSPMDYGADISWLSMFPEEKECLYPPLTFLKPIRVQPIRGLDGKGEVITVKPSFPS